MNKDEKKKALKLLREKERIEFERSLPMDRELFKQLFDFLDEKLTENDCTNEPLLTLEFLRHNNIPDEPVLKWLAENGGYCDCEILNNVEEKFEDNTFMTES